MSSDLDAVVDFLRLARRLRLTAQRELSAVAGESALQTRIADSAVFSADELRAITADLFRATSELLNAELVTAAHVTVLLIRQYLSQANRFGVELATDIAQLEDRRLLHSIKDFEETAFDSMPGQSDISGKEGRLQSINEHILKQEADRLKADQANLLAQHDKLRQTQVAGESRLRRGEETLDAVRAEKNRLEALVDSLSSQISQLNVKQKTIVPSPAPSSAEIDNLNNRILNLEKEIDTKLAASKPFLNLKKMLAQKNDLLRNLRTRLSKYEHVDALEVGGDAE